MKRAFVNTLFRRLSEQPQFIQIVLGPRQVGKTTGVLQLSELLKDHTIIYENADSVFSSRPQWLKDRWLEARLKFQEHKKIVLIIDEVQSISDWSALIKGLWDQDKRQKSLFHVILLGSISLELHQGLSESLAGRYEKVYVPHWSYQESKELFPKLDLEDYLEYGGYPAPLGLEDKERRRAYLRDAILEPVITKDIFQNATVKKPALFRQTFELVCLHAGEVLSFNKFLGQLQEGGNVDLVKHYLNLYQQAFLIRTLEKFSTNKIQKKGSSPKLMPLAPAFVSLFGDIERGRKFELMIGLELIKKYEEITYWREGNAEVDFVIKYKKKIIGIEVKAGNKKDTKGLEVFSKKFKAKTLLITLENFERMHELIEVI
jgi:predicted AAA+ superfamily ATPase